MIEGYLVRASESTAFWIYFSSAPDTMNLSKPIIIAVAGSGLDDPSTEYIQAYLLIQPH